jgi:hypothetical protein
MAPTRRGIGAEPSFGIYSVPGRRLEYPRAGQYLHPKTKVIGWGTMPWDGPMPYTMWTHAP